MGPTWAAAPGLCDRRRSWRAAPSPSRRVVAWGLAVLARFPSVAWMSRPSVPSGGRLGGAFSEGAQDAISIHLGRAGSRAHDTAGRGALPDPRPRVASPLLCRWAAGGALASRPPSTVDAGKGPCLGWAGHPTLCQQGGLGPGSWPGLPPVVSGCHASVPPRERVPRRERSWHVHPWKMTEGECRTWIRPRQGAAHTHKGGCQQQKAPEDS